MSIPVRSSGRDGKSPGGDGAGSGGMSGTRGPAERFGRTGFGWNLGGERRSPEVLETEVVLRRRLMEVVDVRTAMVACFVGQSRGFTRQRR